MKLTYSISQKLKIAISLTIIVVMLLVINILTKKHFSELQRSYSSVYEDRLLVEVHIYRITTYLYDKNILLNKYLDNGGHQILAKNNALNDSIKTRIESYETTLFTQKESDVFENLKSNLKGLYSLEDTIYHYSSFDDAYQYLLNINKYHALLSSNLSQLSNIQREEGKREIIKSNQLVASSKLALQLELVILIVISLIIQALLFAHKSSMPRTHQNTRLN